MPKRTGRLPSSEKLTEKQRRFVEEYLVDANATQAAVRAGYNPKWAGSQANQLLQKNGVAAAIQEEAAKLSERAEVTATDVVRELSRIAMFDLRNVLTFDGERLRIKPSSEWDDDTARAIESVKAKVVGYESGEDGKVGLPVVQIEVKASPKVRALELLAKRFGLLVEKHEHSGTLMVGPVRVPEERALGEWQEEFSEVEDATEIGEGGE